MRDDKNFILNLLVAVQHNLRALDQSLDILRRELTEPVDKSDPRNPVCPKCGDELSDVSTIGRKIKEYQCVSLSCDFRGEL